MTDPDPTPARGSLSRRSLVRTGAHAAWAVPAIVVATGAPALAAASGPAVLTVVCVPTPGGINTVSVGATITNANSQASTNLTIVLVVDPVGGVDFSKSTASSVAGFMVSTDTQPNEVGAVFTYQAVGSAGEVPGGGSLTFSPTITLKPGISPAGNNAGGSVAITVLPDGPNTSRGSSSTMTDFG